MINLHCVQPRFGGIYPLLKDQNDAIVGVKDNPRKFRQAVASNIPGRNGNRLRDALWVPFPQHVYGGPYKIDKFLHGVILTSKSFKEFIRRKNDSKLPDSQIALWILREPPEGEKIFEPAPKAAPKAVSKEELSGYVSFKPSRKKRSSH